MAEVHVIRYSTNPQIRSFQETQLPERFWAPDVTGREREYTFINQYGQVAGFIIDKGGTLKMNTEAGYNQHNYESLQALLRRPEGVPPGSEFKLVNLQKEAEADVTTRQLRVKALVLIDEQKDDLLFVASLARRLGLNSVEKQTPFEVLNYVQARAETKPGDVLDILDSVYQKELFELDKARDAQIITIRNGFYYYGGLQMGASEGAVVDYFHRHADVFSDIIRRNAALYGGVLAQQQDERIREILEGRQSVTTPTSNASILGGADATPAAEADTKTDSETEGLLRKARELGVILEDENADYSRHLAFNHIRLIVPNGPTGYVKQAVAFLAMPANKGVRKQIAAAIDQVERANLVNA